MSDQPAKKNRQVSINMGTDPALQPFDGPPEDDPIHFRSLQMVFPDAPRSLSLENWEVFEGTLLSVMITDGVKVYMHGSAVLVAPGVALSAFHVFEDFIVALTSEKMRASCIGVTPHGSMHWHVSNLQPVGFSDLCILSLVFMDNLPPDRVFKLALLSTRIPTVGERLVAAGFRAGATEFEGSDGVMTLRADPLLSSGVVLDVYPQKRDSVILPFPSMCIDCPAWGGMSGGPVWDSQGRLVGVTTRSFATADDNDPAPMFAMLLYPMFSQPFTGGWPWMFSGKNRALIDYWKVDGGQAVKIKSDGKGGFQRFYSPWS